MSKYRFLLTILSVVFYLHSEAQVPGLEWARNIGGSGFYAQGNSVATDLIGNVYTTGTFAGTIDFDPGPGTHVVTSITEQDAFILKLDANGNFVWVQQMGLSGSSVIVDDSGNVYITGHFNEDGNFGAIPLINNGHTDIFVCKLDEDGAFIWAKGIGGTEYDYGNSIALDGSGNLYITGTYQMTVDFDPGTGSTTLSSVNDTDDIFVSKFDNNGNFIWARSMGGTDYESATFITTRAGNVLITGSFYQTNTNDADFDPGAGTFYLTSNGESDIFICNLTTAGDFVWAKQIGSLGWDNGQSITTDAGGNIYTTGSFYQGTVDFDPGPGLAELTASGNPEDIYILKLDASGNYDWAKNFAGTDVDSNGIGYSITINNTGDVYTAGYFAGTVDFDPDPSTEFFLSSDGHIFVSKLDASGNFKWAAKMGGQEYNQVSSITTDNLGYIYTTGYFGGQAVDFSPGNCTFTLDAVGYQDFFVQKIGIIPSGCFEITLQPQSITTCVGTTITFNVAASGTTNIKYQWQIYNDGVPDFLDLSDGGDYNGTTTAAFTISNISISDGDVFRCKISGDGFADIFSNEVTLTVVGPPAGINVSRCGPGSVTLLATGAINGQYRWYTAATGGTAIAGAVNSNYTTPSLAASTTYFVSIDRGSCETSRTAVLASINSCAPIPELVWAQGFGGAGYSLSMVVDATGNVFTTGYFRGTLDFDPGPGVASLSSAGGNEVYISKLDAAGNLVWAKSVGGTSDDQGNAISVDATGNVYVVGNFRGTADFDPGATSFPLTSAGGNDVFILKLTGDGDFVWANRVGGTPSASGSDSGGSLALTTSGDLFVYGYFYGTVDFDPGAGSFPLTSAGSGDLFILRLTSNGAFVSALKIGGSSFDVNGDMFLDPLGNIFLSGFFYTTTDFNPGAGVFNLTSNGAGDAFVCKLDPTGNFLWAKSMGSVGDDSSTSVRTDATGDVIVTGYFEGTADLDPGPSQSNFTSAGMKDPFIIKLTSAGDFVWAKTIGGTDDDVAQEITTDASNNIYIGGAFYKTVDFDPGPATFNITSIAFQDIFALKVNPNGDFIWVIGMGGISNDFPTGLKLDASENIYITGAFRGTVDFDPGPNTVTLTGGTTDWTTFVQKLVAPTPLITISTQPSDVIACNGETKTFSVNATGTTNIKYQWQFSQDGIIPFTDIANGSGYSNVTTNVLSINTTGNFGAGRYRCRINGDFAAEVISNDEGLFISATPSSPLTTGNSACSSGSLTLTATGGANGQYRWYTVATGGSAITGEVNSTYITPILVSTTTYYVSLFNGSCESTRTPVIATIVVPPVKPAIASNIAPVGNALTICSTTVLTLSAPNGFASYGWSTGAATSQITITATGTYSVTVTDASGCASPASDAIIVTVVSAPCSNQAPVIATSTTSTIIGGLATINLLDLITDADDNLVLTSLVILQSPSSGAIATITNGILDIDYKGINFSGRDQLTIQVCDVFGECTQQILEIDVIGDIEVYNGISPNNDNQNEIFLILNIDLLPDTRNNRVTIYNRWGSKVFEVSDYNNTTNVFKGLSENGSELPSGTYFYKIEFENGRMAETGYLSLKR